MLKQAHLVTDHSRFQPTRARADTCHRHYHGGPQVELVFRLADWWLRRAARNAHTRSSEDKHVARTLGVCSSRGTMNLRLQRLMAIAGLALVLGTSAVVAHDTVRVRGTIERVDGDTYVVKARDGSTLKLKLAPNAGVAASVKSALADIKQGAFIGVAALPQADGTQRALEVHIFHESMRGTGEGHRPWDLLPKSTMTNATVHDVVHAVDAHSVTLKYQDGEQRIVIPADTVVVTYLPGDAAELKAGAAIFVPAANRQADGTLQAHRIMVGRNIAPPQ